jgi:ketosteroid isomerase-like protein
MTLQEAFERRDLEGFVAALDPEVVWLGLETPGEERPVCRNRDEVRSVLEKHLAAGRTGSPEIVAAAGERLVIDPHPEPPVPGLEQIHHVYTLRGGRVVRMEDFPDLAAALAAVGLP